MVIDNTGFDGRGEAGPFCQEVLRECMARGYDGILCDFEGHPSRCWPRRCARWAS
ncbi:hypothetical protein M5E87_16075 [Flavonifractor plautii]|nr:hypothetical protein M5E87_16075 [Flavonifractor plautii]